MLNQIYVIDAAEIPWVREEAPKGSGEAALRLEKFYGAIVLDMKEWQYRLTIAAENGSVVGMYNLGQYLRDKGEPESLVRARYWYERVAKSGQQPLADEAKRRLEDIGD
jgi:TPR repeat protein